MSLYAIIEAIEATFRGLGPQGVKWHVGPEWLAAQEAPPRIVWVPSTDAFEGPEIHYPGASEQAFEVAQELGWGTVVTPRQQVAQAAPEVLERPLQQVGAGVEAHIWGKGKDYTQPIALRDLLVNAIRQTAGAAYQITRGVWPVQTGEAITQYGRVYVLSLSFLTPLMEVKSALATITSTEEHVEMENGGAL